MSCEPFLWTASYIYWYGCQDICFVPARISCGNGWGNVYPWDKYLTKRGVCVSKHWTQVVNKTISLWFNHLYFLIGPGGVRLRTLGRKLIHFYWVNLLEEKVQYYYAMRIGISLLNKKTKTTNLQETINAWDRKPQPDKVKRTWARERGRPYV